MSSTKLLEENMDVFCAIQEISKTLEDFRIQVLKNQILRQQEKRSKGNQTLENLAPPSKSVWKPPDLCAKPGLNGSRLREEEFSEPPKSRQMTYNFIKKSKREDSDVKEKSDEEGKMSSLLTAEKGVDVEILKTRCRNVGVAERSINNVEGIVAEPKAECQDENIEAEMINDAKANITEYTTESSTDEAVEEGYNCHTETTLGQQAKDTEDKIIQKVKRDIPGKQCPQEFHVSDLENWGVARNTISRETEKETIIEEMQFGVDTFPITNTEIVQTNPEIHIVVAEEKIILLPMSAPQIEVNDVEQLPKFMIGNERCCTTPNMVVIEKLNIEDYKEVVHVFKTGGLRLSLLAMNSNYHIFTYTHVCIMGLLYVVKNVSSSDSSSNEGVYLLGSKSCCLVSSSTLKLLSDGGNKWNFRWDEDSLLLQLKDGVGEDMEVIYIGCLKEEIDVSEQDVVAQTLLENFKCVPTFIPPELLSKFYHGFCKQYLWPLFHYMLPLSLDLGGRFDRILWQAYVSVNKMFADKVTEVINHNDGYVWVHDYHLMVLPTFLRKRFNRIANPARGRGKNVLDIQSETCSIVARINHVFGKPGYEPVVLIVTSLQSSECIAYYVIAECCLVSAVRDGMNLIPYEYVVCRQGTDVLNQMLDLNPGALKKSTLVLSEFIGCSHSLSGAIRVNPWNIDAVVESMVSALVIPQQEKKMCHDKHYKYVSSHNVAYWARSFLLDLERACQDHVRRRCWGIGFGLGFRVIALDPTFRKLSVGHIVPAYRRSRNHVILLDYDGTMTPQNAGDASPSAEAINIMNKLCGDPHNLVFSVSSKNQQILAQWFSSFKNLGIGAEHGYFVRHQNRVDWETCVNIPDFYWKQIAETVIQLYTETAEGFFIETKETILVWKYHIAEPDFGSCQAKELFDHLESVLANKPVSVKSGVHIVEVKPQGVSKCLIAERLLASMRQKEILPNFVLCIGDDRSGGVWAINKGDLRKAVQKEVVVKPTPVDTIGTSTDSSEVAAEMENLSKLERSAKKCLKKNVPTSSSRHTARSKAAYELKTIPKDHTADIDVADGENGLSYVRDVEDMYKYCKSTVDEGLVHNNIDSQPEIHEKMRVVLIVLLVRIHLKFKLSQEALFFTSDQYPATTSTSRRELHFVGFGSLFLTFQYGGIWVAVVNELVNIGDRTYSKQQVLVMEKQTLGELEPYVLLVRFIKVSVTEVNVILAYFLIEVKAASASWTTLECQHFLSVDPWGQGSKKGEGNVTTLVNIKVCIGPSVRTIRSTKPRFQEGQVRMP